MVRYLTQEQDKSKRKRGNGNKAYKQESSTYTCEEKFVGFNMLNKVELECWIQHVEQSYTPAFGESTNK